MLQGYRVTAQVIASSVADCVEKIDESLKPCDHTQAQLLNSGLSAKRKYVNDKQCRTPFLQTAETSPA